MYKPILKQSITQTMDAIIRLENEGFIYFQTEQIEKKYIMIILLYMSNQM